MYIFMQFISSVKMKFFNTFFNTLKQLYYLGVFSFIRTPS